MNTQDLIKKFFSNKTKQLLAVSEQAIVQHSSLQGTHRENIIDIYLKEILPKRFSIGKGMVYGVVQKSKETDLLIWDEQNYPSLSLLGHSLFFAESAKAIIEVKTNWSQKEFNDIKKKVKASKFMFRNHKPNILDDVNQMWNEIASLKNGIEFSGTLKSPHHIAFAGFIFYGGEKFSISSLSEKKLEEIEEFWPDVIVFLNAGKVLVKEYVRDEENSMLGTATLNLYNSGENTLLLFTSIILGEIMERTILTENPFYFTDYIYDLYNNMEREQIEYPISRHLPGGMKNL
tara:strand:+ start:1256 stop:2122 length:867 start_codon:yes stop_codon:yes gene_type:complete